ncbi:MAG: glycosyltransferase family 39 protein [Planctomycetota bacterium]|nr:glycosyltransferase family 39 protein [Planctomycetota bacterium]
MNQPPEETSGSGDRAAGRLLLAATLLVTTCYLLPQIQSGWIPHDEGLLAQTAERVLGGEVPHRDFDDMYSGGLTYLHAAAMKVLGTRLSSMRWVLLLASLVGVACWYGIALCFAPPWAAMLSSLLCLAWSTPNYFASLPSWYSLVLASLTTWLLLQYHRQRQSRWLLAVGVCCGLSLMIKIVGLYMIAAALLSLLAISFEPEEGQQRQPPTSSGRLVSLVPGCLLGLLVLLLVRQHLGTGVLMLFVFPSVALAVMLVQIQSHGRGGALPSAIARAIRPGLIFSAGLAVPLVAWVGSYLAAGAVGDLVHGIFVLPRVRLDSVTSALASPWVLAWGLPAMVLLGLGNRRTPARQANLLALLAVVSGLPLLLACLMGPADGRPVNLLASAYKPLFLASFYLPVLVVVSGILIVRQDHPARGERDTRLFIVLGPLAVMTLIQYPYSTGIYFCYYAPLLILGVLAVVRSQRDGWQRSWAGIGIFYLLFAVLMMNFSSPRSLGFVRQGIMRDGPLSERADLAVNLTDLGDYGELLELLETVTQPGEAIYAAPDCPEIYFLANRRNPTRTMYDLFDTRSDREQHLLQMLEDEKVKAVVVNVVPEFSRSLSGRFLAELQRRFPHLERIGIVRRNPSAPASPRFQVYWR